MSLIKIYTDGACSGNPGSGGWGYVILKDNKVLEHYGGEGKTTNNRMEMTAIIQALSICNDNDIIVFTDSKYVIDGITKWINIWKNNNWKTSNKKDVKNKDLWEIIDTILETRNVSFEYVKAHSGNYYNERVDALAKRGINF